jgi:KDO2-lipid IV(A) lauroyltransferase
LVYYGYVVASAIARAVPERLVYALAEVVGSWSFRLLAKKRAVVARNLARVTGLPAESEDVRELTERAFRSYARYWLETFRLVREGSEFFLDRFRLDHDERLDAVLARGAGAVVVVGHLGNWDAAGAWVGATGRRLVTVAEVLKPRRMFEFFADHRARLGMTIFPAESGVTERLSGAVRDGAIVAILGDRDLRGKGPEVKFFGEPTTLPAGPAVVALRTGVPILVAGVYGVTRAGGKRGWEGEMSEPIELPAETGPEAIRELTQRIAEQLEAFVARRPEEWHVFQPFWLADRGSRKDKKR